MQPLSGNQRADLKSYVCRRSQILRLPPKMTLLGTCFKRPTPANVFEKCKMLGFYCFGGAGFPALVTRNAFGMLKTGSNLGYSLVLFMSKSDPRRKREQILDILTSKTGSNPSFFFECVTSKCVSRHSRDTIFHVATSKSGGRDGHLRC